jgi:hypothetical protein
MKKIALVLISLTILIDCAQNETSRKWGGEEFGLSIQLSDKWTINRNPNFEKSFKVGQREMNIPDDKAQKVLETNTVMVFDAKLNNRNANRGNIKVGVVKNPNQNQDNINLKNELDNMLIGLKEQIPNAKITKNPYKQHPEIVNYRADFEAKGLEITMLNFMRYKKPYFTTISISCRFPEDSIEVEKVISSITEE